MKNIITITSVNNEKIKYFLSLKDKKTRYKEKKFLIEGYHLVEEAKKTSLLEAIITNDENNFKDYPNVDKYLVSLSIIEKISSTKNPQNILGIVKMQEDNLLNIKLNSKCKIVLLDDINDPGNLGTIIRTAAALNYDAIIMSNNTVDLYNEKVLRSTQGVIFKIPLIKMDLELAIDILRKLQIKCFGSSLNNAKNLEQIKKPDKFAICFGNEARGVNPNILARMDENIKIPMCKDVESLNVSVASGIIMYYLK